MGALTLVRQYITDEALLEDTLTALESEQKTTSTEDRVEATHRITEFYFARSGKHLDTKTLERLANYIMSDELSSKSKKKRTREYSIISDRKFRTLEDELEDQYGSTNHAMLNTPDYRYTFKI